MGQKFVNNLTLQTSADITNSTSSIPVVSTDGLPTLGVGDWMYLTLADIREGGELRWEVVKLNNYSSNTLSVTRGQDGTTGQAWLAGSSLSNRVTAGDMQELENFKDASRSITLTGDVVGTVSYTGTGAVSIGTTIASTQFAPVVSPALTGTPTAPTPAAGTSTTQLATTEFVTSADNLKVSKDSDTGAALLPMGTTAQRPIGGPSKLRFNTDLAKFEGHNGSAWGSLGGATGGGNDAVFYLNDQIVTADFTVPVGQNAQSAGPITIADGVTVTISDGSVWSII
jgi:hypothetical protein